MSMSFPSVRFVPISCVNTFIMIVGFRCGAINEPANLAGISHFVEHLMFRGGSMDRFQSIGAEWNAHTEVDYTLYYVKCDIKHAKTAMDALVNVVRSIHFSKSEFQKDKKIVIEEISIRPDYEHCIHRIAHQGTIYNNSIGGTEASLSSITYEDVVSYHAHHYHQPMIVYCCNEKYKKQIESWTGKTRPYAVPSMIDVNNGRALGQSCHIFYRKERSGIESCKLLYLGYPMYDPRSEVCSLIAFVLSSRLFDEIREQKNMVYGIKVAYVSRAHSGWMMIDFKSAKFSVDKILRIVMKHVRSLTHKQLESYRSRYNLRRKTLLSDPWNAAFTALKEELYGKQQGAAAAFDFNELFDPRRLAFICHSSAPKHAIEKILGV